MYSLKTAYIIKKELEIEHVDSFYNELKNKLYLIRREIPTIKLTEEQLCDLATKCQNYEGKYDMLSIIKLLENFSGKEIEVTVEDVKYILEDLKKTHSDYNGQFIFKKSLYDSCKKKYNESQKNPELDYEERIIIESDLNEAKCLATTSADDLLNHDKYAKEILKQIDSLIIKRYIALDKLSPKCSFIEPEIDNVEYRKIHEVCQMQSQSLYNGTFEDDFDPALDARFLTDREILQMEPATSWDYQFYIEEISTNQKKRKSQRSKDLMEDLKCIDIKILITDYVIFALKDYAELYEYEKKDFEKINQKSRKYRERKLKLNKEKNVLRGKLGAEQKRIGKALADELSYYIAKRDALKEIEDYGRKFV